MKLVVTTFLSLDGVMQGPGKPDEDRRGDFDLGGWLVPYADDDMQRLAADFILAADGLLLGRRSYELLASFWPHVTDEGNVLATRLNSLPKYVLSRTLGSADWTNSTVLSEDAADEVRKLKERDGRELQVHGSGAVVRTLSRHGLVDEYRLWVYPVLLGRGRRLFEDGTVPTALDLVDTKATGKGVVVHTYRPAGELSFGAFEAA